jgi:hypothetical protein
MPKQTAVEWLIQELVLENKVDLDTKMRDLMYKAAEMEKEQIVNAVDGFPLDKRHLDGEQYYKETYGGNK